MRQIVPLLALLTAHAFGQSPVVPKPPPPRRTYVGLDVFRFIPPLILNRRDYFKPSVLLEAIVQREVARRTLLNVQLGYASVRQEEVFTNLNYHCQGGYFKVGLLWELSEVSLDDPVGFALGANLTLARFRERGQVVFPGQTFGDFRPELVKNVTSGGLEGTVNLTWQLSTRLRAYFQARLGLLPFAPRSDALATYYTPGSGIHYPGYLFPSPTLTGGFTVQLLYQIR